MLSRYQLLREMSAAEVDEIEQAVRDRKERQAESEAYDASERELGEREESK